MVPWLKLVLHNATILDQYYEPWSYAVSTGFEDALRSLMRLADIRFSLPFDLAVRQLQTSRTRSDLLPHAIIPLLLCY